MIELSRGAEREQIPADDKRSALNQILASQTFARSDQLKAFLEFVCEQEFKGEGGGLNEYLIGVQVLGRAEGYSTADDASVRTRAHSLRRKLLDYYLLENPAAEVRIELPKGSYCPQFARVSTAAEPQPAQPVARPGRRLFAAAAGLVVVSGLAGYLIGTRSAGGNVPKVLRDAWGPLLQVDGNVLVCLATPFHLLVRPAPPEAESKLYRPVPDDPDILAWYRERQELPPGNRLFMNSGHNSPLFGDVAGMISAIRLLSRAGVSYEVMPERVVGPFALRNRNVILFGRPEYSRAAALLLEKGWFGVAYHRPANGAAVWYPDPGKEQRSFFANPTQRYGLITVVPSDGAKETPHRTIVVSGSNSAAAHAAAEFLTSPVHMQSLAERFQGEGYAAWPKAWQVVVRTNSEQMLPFDVAYHAHRVLVR
jgi:hypothetical protein